jgi:hypothetical protein
MGTMRALLDSRNKADTSLMYDAQPPSVGGKNES